VRVRAIPHWVLGGTNAHDWVFFTAFHTGWILTCTAQFLSVTVQLRHNRGRTEDGSTVSRSSGLQTKRATLTSTRDWSSTTT
jgi:hypothetical protein